MTYLDIIDLNKISRNHDKIAWHQIISTSRCFLIFDVSFNAPHPSKNSPQEIFLSIKRKLRVGKNDNNWKTLTVTKISSQLKFWQVLFLNLLFSNLRTYFHVELIDCVASIDPTLFATTWNRTKVSHLSSTSFNDPYWGRFAHWATLQKLWWCLKLKLASCLIGVKNESVKVASN